MTYKLPENTVITYKKLELICFYQEVIKEDKATDN